MKIMKHLSIMRLGAVALIAAALTACGGGGGGGGGTGGTTPPPAGATPVATAALASPGTTNTQNNPTQAFGLVNGAGVPVVTVNSPPVVNFTVVDGSGKLVTNLTKSNVSFAIAKLVRVAGQPDQWQSLLYRDEIPGTTTFGGTPSKNIGTGANGKAALASAKQATTEAPTADYTTNCSGAGCLTYNASGGYYTYNMATDITDPSKTNGVTFAKDGTTTYRVAIQLSYPLTAPNALGTVVVKTVLVNPYFDFTVGSDGKAVAVTDPAKTRKMVDIASCNECHTQFPGSGGFALTGLALHGGGRVDVQFCVMCHNPGTTDANTGNVLDFKQMVHKIHMGEDLTNQYTIYGYRDSINNYNDVRFPQDKRNCTKCHDGAADAPHKTPQGDNWMNVPSRAACGACHDNVNFATGDNHPQPGGVRTDDSQCNVCHSPGNIAIEHRTTMATPHNPTPIAGFPALQYNITKATVNASGQLAIDFQILQNVTVAKNGTVTGGTPVALNAYPNAAGPLPGGFVPCDLTGTATFLRTGATFKVAYSTAQDGVASPSDWNSGHDSMYLCEAWAGMNGNSLVVKDAATNTYEVVMAKSTFSKNTTTGVITAGHSLAVPAGAQLVTAVMSDGYKLATLPTGLNADDAALLGAVPGIPSLRVVDGYSQRRAIMDVQGCNKCHDRLGSKPYFHTGNYATDMGPTVDVSQAMCAICHTPNQGGSTTSPWSASFRVWVHGIHSANVSKSDGTPLRSVPFTWHGTSATDNYYTGMTFPGKVNNCAGCHLPGTYDFSDPTKYSDTVINNMLDVKAAAGVLTPTLVYTVPQYGSVNSGAIAYGLVPGTDYGTAPSFDTSVSAGTVVSAATTANNLVSSPITAACSACHDGSQATNHMVSMGGKFYSPRGAKHVNTESCLTCHGKGKEWAIDLVHMP